jgi:hypothetical protein
MSTIITVWSRAAKEYSLILNELHSMSYALRMRMWLTSICSSLRMREYSLVARDHTAMVVLYCSLSFLLRQNYLTCLAHHMKEATPPCILNAWVNLTERRHPHSLRVPLVSNQPKSPHQAPQTPPNYPIPLTQASTPNP